MMFRTVCNFLSFFAILFAVVNAAEEVVNKNCYTATPLLFDSTLAKESHQSFLERNPTEVTA